MNAKRLVVAISVAFGFCSSPFKANGQTEPYLDWFLVDGIAGASQNGEIGLAATISPEDSGRMTNGDISVHSAFESGPDYLPPPFTGPILRMELTTNEVILRWSSAYRSFQLEWASALNGPSTIWLNVMETPVLHGAQWTVTLPASQMSRFFRLRLF